MPVIKSAVDTNLAVSRPITIQLRMVESRTRVTFGLMDKLSVPMLLGPTFVDRLTKSVHPTEKKNIPYHSPPVPILMVHKAHSAAEENKSDICQYSAKAQEILVTPVERKPKTITVAQQVVFKAMCETPLLV